MGLFHCPIGALGYGDDGCIHCGLCAAVTREEKIAATTIMRKWIQENGRGGNADIQIRKIAVCGKGGAGKSTTTALLSGALEHIGYRSVIIDTDSSNGGLWRKLGMPEAPTALSDISDANGSPEFINKSPLYFEEIEEPYVCTNQMRKLVCAGKIEDPLMGCACTIGEFAKILLRNLSPQNRELVIADQEAGVESFGRGIEQCCDTVLILVEPSNESIELAGKIQYMAQGLGIQRVRAILNKIEDEEQAEYVQDALTDLGVRFLGVIPDMKEIRKSNLVGKEITPERAYELVGTLAQFMLDEAEMPYDKVNL